MEITPQLVAAMKIIARVQAGFVEQGVNIGTFGPCGDGIDGRWGEYSRAAYKEYADATGFKVGSNDILQNLGITEINAMAFQNAITIWNQWRNQWVTAGAVDTVPYHEAANAALAQAVPDFVAACLGGVAGEEEVPANPQMSKMQGNGDMATTNGNGKGEGLPWWLFVLIGVVVIGGGIAAYYFYGRSGKRGRRSSLKSPALAAWGSPSVEDEELGDEGYNGYGDAGADGGNYEAPQVEDDDEEGG
jgi:hypothetical protein